MLRCLFEKITSCKVPTVGRIEVDPSGPNSEVIPTTYVVISLVIGLALGGVVFFFTALSDPMDALSLDLLVTLLGFAVSLGVLLFIDRKLCASKRRGWLLVTTHQIANVFTSHNTVLRYLESYALDAYFLSEVTSGFSTHFPVQRPTDSVARRGYVATRFGMLTLTPVPPRDVTCCSKLGNDAGGDELARRFLTSITPTLSKQLFDPVEDVESSETAAEVPEDCSSYLISLTNSFFSDY